MYALHQSLFKKIRAIYETKLRGWEHYIDNSKSWIKYILMAEN